jgi:acetyltransferase
VDKLRKPVIRAVRARLKDGTAAMVRPVRKDDARHADAFFGWLSNETKYLRFMYPVKELTPEIVANALKQEGLRRVALVVEPVEHGEGDLAPAVGIGRYAPTEDPEVCEVAVTVADPWQGRGVGRVVLERLLVLARRAGYKAMSATAFSTNHKMIGLARAYGFSVHSEPGGITTMHRLL